MYASPDEFKVWLLDNTTYGTNAEGTSLDSVFNRALAAASRQIEQDTGRKFELATETRLARIDPDGVARFRDLVTATAVLIDQNADDTPEATAATTDYLLGPLTDEFGGTPARYQWMRARRNSSVRFAPGWLVSIAGTWGYVVDSLPPEDIVQATLIRTAWIVARRDAQLGTVAIPGVGVAASVQRWDTDYWQLIGPYVHTWTTMPAGG